MNTNVPHYHVLVVKYVGQTNTKPSRVKIISEHFKQSILIPFASEHGNDSCEIAEHWLTENGFQLIGHAGGQEHYYVITDTFKPLKGK